MGLLWKGLGICLLTCILSIALGKQEKDITVILTITGCAAVLMIVLSYLGPVINFLKQLEQIGELHADHLGVVVKAAGVGLVAEIAALICADSGNGSLGKILQILGSAVILWLSIPVFEALLELIGSILGDL